MPTPAPTAPSPPNDPPPLETPERNGPPDPGAGAARPETTPASAADTSTPDPSADARPKAGDEAPFAGEVHDWNDTRDRYEMIAEAAYFKAEKRGFALGEEELDWLEAEQELIEAMESDRVTEDD